MKKLLFSLVLLTVCSLSAQAQIDDSLPPWFRVPQLMLEIDERINGISHGQLKAIQSAVQPIVNKAKRSKLTDQNLIRIRRKVREAIVSELSTKQVAQLKATRRGNKDALDLAMMGKPGTRKQKRR